MNSFQTALSAVLPMFVMLVMGNFLKRIKMVDEHTLNKMNTLCFKHFYQYLYTITFTGQI